MDYLEIVEKVIYTSFRLWKSFHFENFHPTQTDSKSLVRLNSIGKATHVLGRDYVSKQSTHSIVMLNASKIASNARKPAILPSTSVFFHFFESSCRDGPVFDF